MFGYAMNLMSCAVSMETYDQVMKSLVAILVLIHAVHSAKILGIFPTPSFSHQIVFHGLMKDLAARGHELLILTPDPFKTDNPNVTQIDLHSSYKIFRETFNFVYFKNSDMDETDLFDYFVQSMMKYMDEQMSHPEVKKLIAEKDKHHFDVIIMEGLLNYPMLAFAEIFDAPVIEISSLDTVAENHKWMGNEANPIVHPDITLPFQSKRLTFYERWTTLRNAFKRSISIPKEFAEMEKFVKKHFPIENPDINKLRSRVEFLMVNAHPALGYIRPILPNTIQLGFMHIEPPKPLQDGPLKTFVDNSKHGVVYMSFGSNVQSTDLGPEAQKVFLNVFRNLKYDFIWKFESDDLPDKPKNVMIQKWLPQADLLAHPKIKLFITQGGQQSMEETIDRAVPIIVIPFVGDQNSNARKIEKLKIGKHLELDTLTEDSMKEAINEMLKPKYKENVQKLRDLIYDEPMTTREKAVWWTEYVIRHKGAKHFYYHGKEVPFYEKFFLDFAAIGIIVALIVIKLCLVVFSKFKGTKNQKRKSE
ncbi:UDP-glycosyltransferase UGT5-like [Chironomus tepperi]|uniref:UDP-glycosyltransferase UGT5-like n=1 Tax=Chironomus tepperi TaxID=113505 RepID=UPI00391EF46A